MLKNKIIVRKIRNIAILLMVIIIMIGAYKNIDRSRAEEMIEIGAIAVDNSGYLEDENIILEAKQIKDDLYEIELPEIVNNKNINKITKITLEDLEETTMQESETGQTQSAEPEIVENKIQLTQEQIDNKQINIKVEYDIALVENEQEEYKRLYNKTLKYEDEENAKLVEVKGYLPVDAELEIEEVSEQQLVGIFGDAKVDVAYDIKIIRRVKTQVPIDEANIDEEVAEIVEIIEINPEDFGQKCEVSIKDVNIEKNSEVFHVKEDNTFEKVEVKENTEQNISFEAETFSIYAVAPADSGIMTTSTETQALGGNYYVGQSVTVSASSTITGYLVSTASSTLDYYTPSNGTLGQSLTITFKRAGTFYIHIKTASSTATHGPYVVTEKTYTGSGGSGTGTGDSSDTESPTDTISPTLSINDVTASGGQSSSSGTG